MITRVEVADVVLEVLDEGTGPVVLLVHGFPLDRTMWSSQVAELKNDYRIIAPNLRGFGAEAKVSWGSNATKSVWTMEQFADDLASLLQVLRIEETVTFCGLSMGGYIGWQFAQKYSDQLRGLVLCDTKAAGDPPEVARGRQMMADQVESAESQSLSEGMLPKLVAASTFKRSPEVVAQLKAVMDKTAPATIAAAQRGMATRPDMTGFLSQIAAPTLAICGEHDAITPPQVMQDFVSKMPNASYVQIESAGHLAPLENPAATNRHVRDFLRKIHS